MELGRFGVWTGFRSLGEERGPEAAALAEELGYGTFWLGGSPRLPQTRPLLAATERIVVATGIVNVWAYDDPGELAAEYHELEREFPGRLLLGIGIGHPEATSVYERPLQKMRHFFDALAQADPPVPRERMIVAALGPKMLDLSYERSLGTHPYFVPPSHATVARERLGAGAVIAPEIAVVLDEDAERARATARRYARLYLGLRNYTDNLLRLGYTPADIDQGGSDRLIDDVVPQGSAPAMADATRAHLEAGADHVCVQTVGVEGVPRAAWTALARELIG